MSVLPIPTEVVSMVDNMIIDFLWSKRKPKIKKDVVIQSIENGGIKVPKFATMVEANRMSWIKRLLNDSNAKWKSILGALAHPLSITHFIETFLDEDNMQNLEILFYKQLFQLWNRLRTTPTNIDQYLEMILWKNKYIKLPVGPKKKEYRSLMWKNLYVTGIVKVKDLFDNNGCFIDLDAYCTRNNIQFNFIKNMGIRKAIPHQWKTEIAANNGHRQVSTDSCNFTININEQSTDIRYSTAKTIYDLLITKIYVKPTALHKWEDIYDIDETDWPYIFKQPYTCSRETRLQSFQYKIIHRIVSCNKWLFSLKVFTSPNCTKCTENGIDNIQHFFIECSALDKFWMKIENWWNRTATYQIKITDKHVIFGLYYDNNYYKTVNFVILLGKWYIYRQSYLDKKVEFFDFLVLLKSRLETEKYICRCQGQINKFDKMWSEIMDNL